LPSTPQRVRGEQRGIEEWQDVPCEVLDCLPVGKVTEVPHEEHPVPALDRVGRPLRDLGQRQHMDSLRTYEVGQQVSFLLRHSEDAVGGVVGVQLARCHLPEPGVQVHSPSEGPPCLAQEVDVDRVDHHPRTWRLRTDDGQELRGGLPERDEDEVELVRPEQTLGSGEAVVHSHSHLAESMHVALLGHRVVLAGEEGHLPAGPRQEPDGVVHVL
jgi:hypothetical protein